MSIPVPPSPTTNPTNPDGSINSTWDQWYNNLQQAFNNAGGSVLQPNAGGTGQSSYTNGQLLIGNTTGNTIAPATLTPGTNIGITNGPSSITIGLTGSISQGVGGTGFSSYTDGQLLIGKSSNGSLVKATLTAGTGISITNGGGSITVSSNSVSPINKITKQIFTSSGTYTPTTGMVYCVVEAVGGGGGGGGATHNTASNLEGLGMGGQGGNYVRSILNSSQIGSSQTVSLGAGGTGGVGTYGSVTNGGTGGNTTLGSTLVKATGGSGGNSNSNSVSTTATSLQTAIPLSQNTGGSDIGDVVIIGQSPGSNLVISVTIGSWCWFPGPGGNSVFGIGGQPTANTTAQAGNLGVGYGAGGGGAVSNSGGSKNGAAGTAGYMIITEYLSV